MPPSSRCGARLPPSTCHPSRPRRSPSANCKPASSEPPTSAGPEAITNLLGYLDLRQQTVERAAWAASRSDDPLRVIRSRWQRGHVLMAAGAYEQGLRLMEQVRHDLGDDPSKLRGAALSLYGSLHLRSAILAGRSSRTTDTAPGRAQLAWQHLEEARTAARLLGRDHDHYGTAFGPSNVAQHEVAVAVELEDGAEAISRGQRVRLASSVPPVRRGHHWIDLARGYLLHGDHQRALGCLERARRIAPQQVRHHPMVRETVLAIASAGRVNSGLAGFASWLGVDP